MFLKGEFQLEVEVVYPVSAKSQSFAGGVQELKDRLHRMLALGYKERLALLNELSDTLLGKGLELQGDVPTVGLPFLVGFLQQANLRKLIAREILNPQTLEHFVSDGEMCPCWVCFHGLLAL